MEEYPEIDDFVDNSDVELANNTYNKYICVEVSPPYRKGINLMEKVMRMTISNDQNMTSGTYNSLADHSSYEVQVSDGTTEELTLNVIVENMFSGYDSEGHHFQLLVEITDHKRYFLAVRISNGFIISENLNQVPKNTIRGRKLLVEWKNSTVDCVSLNKLDESNPIKLS